MDLDRDSRLALASLFALLLLGGTGYHTYVHPHEEAVIVCSTNDKVVTNNGTFTASNGERKALVPGQSYTITTHGFDALWFDRTLDKATIIGTPTSEVARARILSEGCVGTQD